jgi:hypothetical protein
MIEFLSKTGTASKLLGLDIWLWHKSTRNIWFKNFILLGKSNLKTE